MFMISMVIFSLIFNKYLIIMYAYNFIYLLGHVWETPHVISKTSPTIRYGHSSVLFGVNIK